MGAVGDSRSVADVEFRVNQGVSKRREQTKVFKLTTLDPVAVKTATRAAYRQIFERDIEPYIVQNEFTVLESRLANGEINVKEFIEGLGTSNLYIKEFYTPYPNTKVIEMGTKHFLGRAPLDQAEIRKYNQILASEGLTSFIRTMLNSQEYAENFGEDTVPYRRFPTLPAANFPNTQRLYNQLTKQNKDVVVPSFEPAKSRLDITKMPLMSQSLAELAKQSQQITDLGRSVVDATVEAEFGSARRKPARIYRLTPDSNLSDKEQVIQAIYMQVMDVFSEEIPQDIRRADLESKLKAGEISVREFVRLLAGSEVYVHRFYTPYPGGKVVEFLFRHLLGRSPATQAEIQQYTAMLVDSGLKAAIDALVNSAEYARYFGEDVVPYKRIPSLPADSAFMS
jgi:phycobilisome core-membrane linker protein